jgi:hypothetical protein
MVGIADHDLQLRAGIGCGSWSVSFPNDELFPAATPWKLRVQKLRGEPLSPLNVELTSFAILSREVVSEIQPETTRGVGSGIRRNLKSQGSGTRGLYVGDDSAEFLLLPPWRIDVSIDVRSGVESDASNDPRTVTACRKVGPLTGRECCGASGKAKE